MNQEEYIRWLAEQGIDITDPWVMNQLGGQVPPLNEDGEFEFINTNQLQDNFQIMNDPAFLATLGDSDGGYTNQAFQPQVTYEPVKAPGYQRVQQYAGSSDPVSRYIAEVMLDQGTAYQAEVELRDIYADPTHPLHAEIAPYLLPVTDPVTGKSEPDWGRIGKIASSLERDILYDPNFSGFGPDGLPANIKEEETEAAKFFRESDLPMPDARYGLESMRSPEKFAQTQQAPAAIASARTRALQADEAMKAAMARMNLSPQSRSDPAPQPSQSPGGLKGLLGETAGAYGQRIADAVPDFGSVSGAMPDMERTWAIARSLWGGWGETEEPQRPSFNLPDGGLTQEQIETLRTKGPEIARNIMGRMNMGVGEQSRSSKNKKAVTSAARQKLDAQREARERQYGYGRGAGAEPTMNVYERTMARQLAEQGRTPLNDTLAARRAAMARYGLQV